MWQCCQLPPGTIAPTAAIKAVVGFGGDQRDAGETACDAAAEERQSGPSSLLVTSIPRISRNPLVLTPVATRVVHVDHAPVRGPSTPSVAFSETLVLEGIAASSRASRASRAILLRRRRSGYSNRGGLKAESVPEAADKDDRRLRVRHDWNGSAGSTGASVISRSTTSVPISSRRITLKDRLPDQ